jgi:hypothetical protein
MKIYKTYHENRLIEIINNHYSIINSKKASLFIVLRFEGF